MKIELPVPYYLQKHESSGITLNDDGAIPYQWIINYIDKILMVFTGTDLENSVKD